MAAIPVFATCMYAKDWVPTLGLGLRLGPNIRVLGSGFLSVSQLTISTRALAQRLGPNIGVRAQTGSSH